MQHKTTENIMPRLLKQKEVAELLGVSEAYLEAARFQRKDIPYIKIGGRSVRYKLDDVLAYLEKQRVAVD